LECFWGAFGSAFGLELEREQRRAGRGGGEGIPRASVEFGEKRLGEW